MRESLHTEAAQLLTFSLPRAHRPHNVRSGLEVWPEAGEGMERTVQPRGDEQLRDRRARTQQGSSTPHPT